MNLRIGIGVYFFLLNCIRVAAQGSLMLVGGGTENYNSWSDQPYSWFVQRANAGVIINIDVSATSNFYPGYFRSFGAAAATHALQIPTIAAANDPATYNDLVNAAGIFIEGGDQWDYVSTWKGTLVETAIQQVFNRGGAIGGTSAGMAILGEVVFDAKFGTAYPDCVAYNPLHKTVSFTDDFLNLLPGVFTDTHFTPRTRLGRLVPMLARRLTEFGNANLLGIGVDEKTALCIEPDKRATVYGEQSVTLLYPSSNSYISASSKTPPTFSNINYDQLLAGAVYDLNTRTLLAPGPYLQALGSPPPLPSYSAVTLNGAKSTTARLAPVYCNNVTSNANNAVTGKLTYAAGRNSVPQAIITPQIWAGLQFATNRLVSGVYGAVNNPFYTAIYLDKGNSTISASGILSVNTLAYVLDTRTVTHAGKLTPLTTNIPGLVKAKLHFLGNGDAFDLRQRTVIPGLNKTVAPLTNEPTNEALAVENYPNPFNPATTIFYRLPNEQHVRVEILDALGRRVTTLVDGLQTAGNYRVRWEASRFAAGVYFVRLQAESVRILKKCLLVK